MDIKINKSQQKTKTDLRHSKKCIECGIVYFKSILRSKKDWNKSKFCSKKCHYLNMVGKPSPHKRRKMTKKEIIERKKNPKAWAGYTKGKKLSDEHKLKLRGERPNSCGEKNGNWKGGISAENKKQRIKFSRELQKSILERDKYTCQICNQRGGQLQVDHIQPWSKFIELRFDIDNCRTLCMSCHYKLTFKKEMPKDIKSWGHNLTRMEN